MRLGKKGIVLLLGLAWLLTGCEGKPQKPERSEGREKVKLKVGGAATFRAGEPERTEGPGVYYFRFPSHFGRLYIPADDDPAAAGGDVGRSQTPGSYDPRSLMPMAVGNSWTYRWRSAATRGGGLVTRDAIASPLFQHTEFYIHADRMKKMLVSASRARAHQETYKIVRRDARHYFFEVTSDPNVDLDLLRDGRYNCSVENAWTWTDNKSSTDGSLVLTESIKRKTDIGFHYMFKSDAPVTADIPDPEKTLLEDHRMVLFIPFKSGKWGFSKHPSLYKVGVFVMMYRFSPQDIEVPAGKFSGCLEVVEYSYDRKPYRTPSYRTHTFWAPGTGIVREYQELADGTIAFERELVRFTKPEHPANE